MGNIYSSKTVALVFLVFGFLWIILTDLIVAEFAQEDLLPQMFKGLLFVILTTTFLFYLLKKHDEELTENDLQFEMLFQNNPLPMLIYDCDEGRLLRVNLATVEVTGYSESQLREMGISYLLFPHETQALKDKKRDSHSFNIYKEIKDKRDKFRHFQLNIKLLNYFGIDSVLISVYDLTEILNAKNELTELKDNLQLFKNAVHNSAIILTINKWGEIVDANNSFVRIMKANAEITLIGKNLADFSFYSEKYEKLQLLISDLDFKEFARSIVKLKNFDGDIVWFDMVVNPIDNIKEENFLCICFDITERKRLQESLVMANRSLENYALDRTKKLRDIIKEKEDILAIAAHDLKNPLNGIMLNAEILKDKIALGATTEECHIRLDKINVIALRMTEIINNMLELSQVESESLKIVTTKFEANKELEGILENAEQNANAKGIEFVIELENIVICSDKNIVSRVLENLVSNAVKFCSSGDKIYVKSYLIDDGILPKLIFEIADSGPGISEADQEKLFTKFAKLSAKPTGNEISTGMGLAIVKNLSEAINAKVWCVSKLNQGSTFYFAIPISKLEYEPKYNNNNN